MQLARIHQYLSMATPLLWTRQSDTIGVLGLAIGVAGALSLGRFLRSLLYGVGAADPLALFGAVLLLAIVALAACVLPALRAVGIDPMTALRAD